MDMSKLQREAATHREDLPHGYVAGAVDRLCALCDREQGVELHAPAAREVAFSHPDGLLERELGS